MEGKERMEKVLVAGATGFIGYEVAKHLSERGFNPRLLVRRPFRGMILKSLDAELVQGDLLEAHSLRRAVAGIDTIIHLGAVAEESGMRFASFRPPHVFGARSLFFEEARKGRILFPGHGSWTSFT